jgi:hypothetical protein
VLYAFLMYTSRCTTRCYTCSHVCQPLLPSYFWSLLIVQAADLGQSEWSVAGVAGRGNIHISREQPRDSHAFLGAIGWSMMLTQVTFQWFKLAWIYTTCNLLIMISCNCIYLLYTLYWVWDLARTWRRRVSTRHSVGKPSSCLRDAPLATSDLCVLCHLQQRSIH